MIGGVKVPEHVTARETTDKGVLYHGFLRIMERNVWIAEDPENREAVFNRDPRVLQAWKSFSIVLHPSAEAARLLRLSGCFTEE